MLLIIHLNAHIHVMCLVIIICFSTFLLVPFIRRSHCSCRQAAKMKTTRTKVAKRYIFMMMFLLDWDCIMTVVKSRGAIRINAQRNCWSININLSSSVIILCLCVSSRIHSWKMKPELRNWKRDSGGVVAQLWRSIYDAQSDSITQQQPKRLLTSMKSAYAMDESNAKS